MARPSKQARAKQAHRRIFSRARARTEILHILLAGGEVLQGGATFMIAGAQPGFYPAAEGRIPVEAIAPFIGLRNGQAVCQCALTAQAQGLTNL